MESFKVISNERVSSKTFCLKTDRPKVEIRAGQCFSVGTNELGINREYSIYSGANEDYLEFLIREVDEGVLTPTLGRKMPGDYVEIGGPYGEFCLDPVSANSNKFVFIASGTGIAPFHSFAKTFPMLDFKLFHGIRLDEEQYDRTHYGSGKYFPAISRPQNSNRGQRVTDLIANEQFNGTELIYLCGNRSMITDVIMLLRSKGVPGSTIFTETFF